MTTECSLSDDNQKSPLPPFIFNNQRQKVEAEKISLEDIALRVKKSPRKDSLLVPAVIVLEPPAEPRPVLPLAILQSPEKLYFEIDTKIVVKKLWVWNGCPRLIYIHCCGLWDDTSRLGADWRCYPRTRFLLAPGIKAEMFIRATPHDESPVPYAFSGFQLAAQYPRDNVTGYFFVPIEIKFKNYSLPLCEDE